MSREPLEAFHHGVEQRAEDAGAFGLERGPQFCLRPAAFLRNRLQRQEHGTISEIRPFHDLFDAVEDHRPRGVEQHLVLIRVKLPHREAAAGRQPAKRVGNPPRQTRDVVEGQYMAVAGGDEQVAIFAR